MADVLTPRSPLQSWRERFAQLAPSVDITEEPFTTMTTLWVDPSGPGGAAAAKVLGVDLPVTPCTYATHSDSAVIWVGPEEWLVTSASASPVAQEHELRSAVVAHGGSATDVSGQRTTLRLRGPHTLDILTKGCSLDLHPQVYTLGSAAQTALGEAGVILMAMDGTGTDYRILVRSSFARYLADWLLDAAAEYTDTP
ncbi:sarcosine oxidase subunit gamma [Hoyosella altamirensis]|uniref:Sarcosine oxidase subunit gamma n=1 Tax=Hoyosella altamirensis TaxID=616997 RepID=A0A839RRM6_9ACTN|nr:sarcosine oxidase subunit gamma family protein [Hoyosella altamirensis]MBB3039190.1 sarcosine oxidase subunit gamma [Hoyosella altamirensis]